MIQTTVAEVVANRVTVQIVRRATNSGAFIGGKRTDVVYTDILNGERLCTMRTSRTHGVMYDEQKPGSVIGSALKNNDDPIEALDRARKNGEKLHWLNPCASVLHAGPHTQEVWTLLEDGMIVKFEGVLFTVKVHGEHAKLIPLAN